MIKFKSTITKEEIHDFPQAEFRGKIHLFQDLDIPEWVVNTLNVQKVVGFDTETKPAFVKGRKNKVSLMQLACQDECFLFRLKPSGLAPELLSFFSNASVVKVGLSSKDDFHMLRASSAEFEPQNVVELQSYVKQYGIEEMSLLKIYAILFGERISKSQRLSNWDAEQLNAAQQQYAALDAWAVRRIYLRLSALPPSQNKALMTESETK
ncbi:MAG: 3'-5' exonuclease domain-containing protein 2 [Bacteroidales bacterium]|nr:3'-5' exonuclease domain-containing protein 2 [Bacteroidales bacterium]MDD3432007.1 3'-5' exonuclease domain-containing protein 2 [Bacteroidales bacterium]MDD4360944.1 3'-5' exonuclease domain-containing protein 2 [Bacteroidales bacterium]